jgi:hypothetical protein
VVIERGVESAGHFRSHTLPLAHPTLHAPVQTTWQVAAVHPTLLLEPTVKLHVAPDVQLRLALLPAVTVHVLPALHVPLHELPLVPLQSPVVHASYQLATAGSQPMVCGELPPQAAAAATTNPQRIRFIALLPDQGPRCRSGGHTATAAQRRTRSAAGKRRRARPSVYLRRMRSTISALSVLALCAGCFPSPTITRVAPGAGPARDRTVLVGTFSSDPAIDQHHQPD